MSDATNWKKLPAIAGRQQPCLHAGVAESIFLPDWLIEIGFGYAELTCDNRLIWNEGDSEWGKCLSGAGAEEIAAKDPDHDWRISLQGAMSGREYQRHGPARWVLVHQDKGFS